jgi:erythronate-4-phosphate dehydrogenase
MNIFIDENIPFFGDVLKRCGEITLFKGRELTKFDLISGNCDFLFVRSTTKVNQDLLEQTQVKYVGSATSGTDHIDLNYLSEKLIQFSDAKGSNANSVAEYVIYSILKWSKVNNINLEKLKIGIIGYGNIGKLVAAYSHLLGLDVYVNDPPLLDSGFQFPDFIKYTELKEIIRTANIITNHVPLIKSGKYRTYRLIDENLINLVNKDSLFIHTSRGGVVDEAALINALSLRKFFAVIDVWENEPYINSLLCRLSFLATPHIAGYSFDGKIRGVKMMADFFYNVTNIKPDYSIIDFHLNDFKPIAKEFYSKKDELLDILENNRKFSEDYKNFLRTMLYDEKERAFLFDEIRKNYPKRRESLTIEIV